jgi:hypothetical protein
MGSRFEKNTAKATGTSNLGVQAEEKKYANANIDAQQK